MTGHAVASLVLSLAWANSPSEAFDDQVNSILKAKLTPGCAIAYSESGKLKFAKGYGFASLEHQVKMRPEHLHELASVSKQFTAAGILQLRQSGKLSLDDSLRKYFPSGPEAWEKVRIRHLLQHSGGLPDYLAVLSDPGQEVTAQRLFDSIKDRPLRFEPGSKFEYSNSGYMMLGQILEKVSNQTMGAYLSNQLFRPAGMKTALLNDTRPVIPNRSEGYSVLNGKIVREGYTSSSLSKTGDGQVMASALDLIAWDAALRTDAVLSAESRKLMQTPPEFRVGNANYYGFGVSVLLDGGKTVQHHGGGWMGTSTFFARYLDEGKCLVILCNGDQGPARELLGLCEDRFIGRRVVSAARG